MIDDIKSNLVDILLRDKITERLGDGEDDKASIIDSLTNAAAESREQELHGITMEQESQKVVASRLKNEQTIQKIEIDKAKAVAEGLDISPQEPIKVPKPVFPSNGEVLSYMLTQKDPNISKGLTDAVANRMNELRATGQRSVSAEALKHDEWLRDQFVASLKQVDTDKHLAYSPFGQAGGILGGILDIVTGPLDLGTEVFGGKLPPGEKANLYLRAVASSNPIVTAQMRDLLGRDKMEQSAEQYLSRHGLGNMSSMLKGSGDTEGADEIVGIGIDVNNALANNEATAVDFSSESVTGLGRSFDAFQNVHALIDSLKYASTEAEVVEISQQIQEADAAMREPILRFLNNGGTPEQLQEKIFNAQRLVKSEFMDKPLQYVGDNRALQFEAKRKAVGKDFVDKFGSYYNAVVQGMPVSVDQARKSRMSPEAQAKFDKLDSEEPFMVRAPQGVLDRKKEVPVNKEDYATLISEAEGQIGNHPNKARSVVKKLIPNLPPEKFDELRTRMLRVADPVQHSAINKIFKSIGTSQDYIDRWGSSGVNKVISKMSENKDAVENITNFILHSSTDLEDQLSYVVTGAWDSKMRQATSRKPVPVTNPERRAEAFAEIAVDKYGDRFKGVDRERLLEMFANEFKAKTRKK